MRVEIEDFETGWFQLHIGIKSSEIDSLIDLLKDLKKDQNQHFHLSSDYEGDKGVGDIEFYIQGNGEQDNMVITDFAISPTR